MSRASEGISLLPIQPSPKLLNLSHPVEQPHVVRPHGQAPPGGTETVQPDPQVAPPFHGTQAPRAGGQQPPFWIPEILKNRKQNLGPGDLDPHHLTLCVPPQTILPLIHEEQAERRGERPLEPLGHQTVFEEVQSQTRKPNQG